MNITDKNKNITAEDLELDIDMKPVTPSVEPTTDGITAVDLDIEVDYKSETQDDMVIDRGNKNISPEQQRPSGQELNNQQFVNQSTQQSGQNSPTFTNEQVWTNNYDQTVQQQVAEGAYQYIDPMMLKNQKWEKLIGMEFFNKSFFIRSVIAFAIYSSIFFIDFTMQYFWSPIVFLPIFKIFFSGLFVTIANGNEELFMQLGNIYFDNAIYFVLAITIIPLFWKEIKASAIAMKKRLWLIATLPVVHFASLWVSIFVTTFASFFFTLPDSSKNQEAIEKSMAVSPWANVFPTVFGAPFVEEIIFRAIVAALAFFVTIKIVDKVMKSSKSKYITGAVVGTIVSAIFFGLIHVASRGDYLAIFPYLAMGLSFGFIYFATGRNLLFSILIHMYHNGFSIIISLFMS